MLRTKDNFLPQHNHVAIIKLTAINRYKFQSVVLRKCFTNTKLVCTPLIMSGIHSNKDTVLARFLCILTIKRISKEAIDHNQLKVCLHVH